MEEIGSDMDPGGMDYGRRARIVGAAEERVSNYVNSRAKMQENGKSAED